MERDFADLPTFRRSRRMAAAAGAAVLTGCFSLTGCGKPSDGCDQSFDVGTGVYTHMPIEYKHMETMISILPPMGRTTSVRFSGDAKGNFDLVPASTTETAFGPDDRLIVHLNGTATELTTSCRQDD